MSLFRFFRKENACHFLVNPDGRLAQKYAHFKALLENNNEALDILAGLEQLYYGGGTFSMAAVRDATKRLSDATGELVVMLNALVGNRYPDLREALARVEAGLTPHFGGTVVTGGADADPVLSLAAVDPAKAWLVGGKAANMAVMRNQLGMPTPDGFSITSAAFEAFLNVGGLRQVVEAQLDRASPLDLEDLEARCRVLRAQVMATDLPQAIATDIMAEVDRLEREAGGPVLPAMRSSAVGEDSQASFAGQYTTILNVGRNGVLDAYKSVVASKYTPSAILYRLRYGLDEADTPMCVLGLVMVPSRASGVLYTADPGGQLDPEGAPALRVNAVLGLGEQLVSGRATPDVFLLARSPLRILQQDVSAKSERLVALADGGTSPEAVSGEEGQRASVSEAVVLDLGRPCSGSGDALPHPAGRGVGRGPGRPPDLAPDAPAGGCGDRVGRPPARSPDGHPEPRAGFGREDGGPRSICRSGLRTWHGRTGDHARGSHTGRPNCGARARGPAGPGGGPGNGHRRRGQPPGLRGPRAGPASPF
ncbi:PEP/pyruvate-binding domain-containing protein [Nitratidesulfovibrio liaohensis]|uniref:Phosphoenolpyruvate synthase n=1 Tax=Nitratidesulfovibrio liaohensis TaxID=2604158 RepID=A0ABY9R594_9BACT|nr:PEP/pyruvate-binding domain-containing protein [Nitratidesulfovibrio liaohensis]WMW66312.1 PEP/pyruvate-binding domain-containing protein [Nitratidesulfovibrio liaohensis]